MSDGEPGNGENGNGESGENGEEVQPDEQGKFDQEYVTRLRSEAAERRRKARELEGQLEAANGALRQSRDRLLALETRVAAAGILADPDDLSAHVVAADLYGDDGEPDPEKIKAAARALVERKPYLGPRQPVVTGDVDQGAREPTPPPFGETFSDMLRKAAG